MSYKRPNDQYTVSKAREMIEEIQRAQQKPLCTYTTIINYKKLSFYGHPHAGTVVHICSLNKGHEGKCKCICETEFIGWGEK